MVASIGKIEGIQIPHDKPAMIYEPKCWHKMSVAEIRMSRWTIGKTKKDGIKNECFKK